MKLRRILQNPWAARVAFAALALALIAPYVFARAGGGGGYSGGGGGGGGDGGGGGGLGILVYLWIQFAIAHPVIGVPGTIIMLYIFYAGGKEGKNQYVGRTIVRGAIRQQAALMQAQLAALAARDPGFDDLKFRARMSTAFLKIQKAWSGQDMTPARAFISDAVHERFSIYLAMQQSQGIRNDMQNVRVLKTEIVSVECDKHFDTIHVSFTASAVDTDVSMKDGKLLRNTAKRAETFVEVWSFLRRPGAKTLKKPGLIEGFCPNCGAPLKISQAAKCESCSSWVNSGQYDWVLAEITQSCEWRVHDAKRTVPGLAARQAADEGLNVQFLEDRASVLYWRWQLAHWEPNAETLPSIAAPVFTKEFLANQAHQRVYFRNAAVGSVEVLALEPGPPLDKAYVLVKWSGVRTRVEGGKSISEGQGEFAHVLIMGRKSGAKTDVRSGLRSLVCPSCGAPPSNRRNVSCEFCSTSFNDGSRQWILVGVTARGLWRVPAGARATPAEAARLDTDWSATLSPVTGLAIMIGTMISDGHVDPREMSYAQAYARKHRIPPERLNQMLQAARGGRLEVPRPKNVEESKTFLKGIILMSLADGKISRHELKTLTAFGAQLKMPPTQIQKMINTERAELYRKAKLS